MNREIDILRNGSRELALHEPEQVRMPNAPQVDRIDMRWLLGTLRRRRKLVIGIALGVFALALALTFLKTPSYTASARVVLNVNSDQIVPEAKTAEVSALTQDTADTEVQIIQSRDLAQRAADSLLASNPRVADALIDPRPGFVSSIKRTLIKPAPVPTDRASRRERLVEAIISQSDIQRAGTTFAVNVAFAAQDPNVAAAAANEIADTYTRGQYDAKKTDNQEATGFLSKRLEELRVQANADNANVQGYRIANNLLSTSGASLTEQEISSYNQRVADARTEAAGDVARLAAARSQLRSGSKGDDVGEALGSSVVSALRAKRSEVSGRLASASARHGDLNPDVIRARNELADVDQQIEAEIKRVISNLDAKVRVSQDRLGSIAGTLSGARGTLAQNNRASVQLTDLQRRADASQQLYESYLNRFKELSAREGTEKSDAKMITRATPPSRPSSPNLPLNAALGLMVGLGLGLAAAFGAEIGFSGLTNGEDVQRRLGLRYLGGVPMVRARDTATLIDIPVSQPHSLLSNALRNVRSTMSYTAGQGAQIFAMTSALPGEGKTATSVALGRSIALAGDTVLVIDCDFRRFRLSKMIQGTNGAGLIEVLAGTVKLQDALVRDDRSGAWLLPISGEAPEAGRLLTGPAMDALLERVRADYSYVILDTPPVLAVPETREIAAKADATVMLVRWRKTADHAVRTALGMLPRDFVRVIGVVLTAINVDREAGWGSGDASYYHNQYKNYLN